MTAKDRFPLFPGRAEGLGQPVAGTRRNRTVILTRILKASVWCVAAVAIVFAVVVVENPVLFGNVEFLASAKALLLPVSPPPAPPQDSAEAAPVAPAATEVEAAPLPVASEPPPAVQTAAASKPAERSETESRPAPSENLLGQFQAWAAGEAARTEVAPAPPVQVQDAPAPPVRDAESTPVPDVQPLEPVQDAQAPAPDAGAQIGSAQKPAPVPRGRNAKSVEAKSAEVKPKPLLPKPRRDPNAQFQLRPAPDARAHDVRAQEAPVQNTRPLTFLESLGFRDFGSRE
jgi:hypothetical protein